MNTRIGILAVGFGSEVSVATLAINRINKPRDLPKLKQAPVHLGGGVMVIPHPKTPIL